MKIMRKLIFLIPLILIAGCTRQKKTSSFLGPLDENIKNTILEASSGNFTKDSDTQKIGGENKSYLNMAVRNELGQPIE